MSNAATPEARMDEEGAWAAFQARDRGSDGAFVVAVRTTHIYCKPSCPARRPRRENVEFHADGAAARAAGYRPCLRCRPDDAARDSAAVAEALRLIAASEARLSLDAIARATGYAPHHFHRLFKRDTGLTPAAYTRSVRADRLAARLRAGDGNVTEAIYRAGYEAPSRAYADARVRLGMTPTAWRNGGAGEVIRHTVVATRHGSLLVAATDKGPCHIAFGEGETELRAHFPRAEIVAGGEGFAAVAAPIVALVEDMAKPRSVLVPMPVGGDGVGDLSLRPDRAGHRRQPVP
ncbi:helix-turn-helix domain-containing protein [Sphingobium sufflavum]|uniref:bifunctional transcriptional activator/DNA repair enzyme AdaA n=1 Tax=Sphingobium sufflavum TaxID=1129547 RepID=UPI001F38DB10|nr:Ada metal-binding domain-containing protein [Sphingobium sufflavum]MCE7797720.1 helix-turn-helix domain-containing protein [Sphingobium sufflavum]